MFHQFITISAGFVAVLGTFLGVTYGTVFIMERRN